MSNDQANLSQLIQRYQKIVKAEASIRALDATLELIKDVSESRLEEPEGRASSEIKSNQFFPPEAIEIVEPRLKEVRVNRTSLRLDVASQRRLYQIVAALALPGLIGESSPSLSPARRSLLVDAAQVLLHQAYFVLVVDSTNRSAKVRTILLDVFLRFAERLPSAADKFRTLSLVYEAMGERAVSAAFARQSLQQVRPDEHEYLTALQAAWNAYIDQGEFRLAMILLMGEFADKRILEENFAEFQDLMQTTLEMWHDAESRRPITTSD